MKTLIWNGSPRRNGDTVQLIGKQLERLEGVYRIVDAYAAPVQPCVDCRYCRTHAGCRIDDGMRMVYADLERWDNILIASPICFSELTGRLLDGGSRLQCDFRARHFQKIELLEEEKKGAVVLVGGGDGHMERAYATACTLLKHMHAGNILPLVYSHDTNRVPAVEDEAALRGIAEIADFFNTPGAGQSAAQRI